MIWQKNQRRFDRGLDDERYNVAHNPLGTVPNSPLASAPGRELHPPILSILSMNGGQVNIERVCPDVLDIPEIICQDLYPEGSV